MGAKICCTAHLASVKIGKIGPMDHDRDCDPAWVSERKYPIPDWSETKVNQASVYLESEGVFKGM